MLSERAQPFRGGVLAGGASIVLVAGALGVVLVSAARPPTLVAASYGAGSPGLFVLSLLTAVALVAGGCLASVRLPRVAPALVLTGAVWTVPGWSGWVGATGWTDVAAQASAVLLPGAVLASTLVAAGATSRPWRCASGALVAGAVVASLLWDSFDEPGCWRACRPALLESAGSGEVVLRAVLVATLIAGVVLAVAIVRDPSRGRGDGLAASVGSLAVLGLVAQVLPPATVGVPVVGPPRTWAFLLSQVAALVLVGYLGWRRARPWATSVRLTRLARDIAHVGTPAGLESALRTATHDPALTVAWWAPARGAWVDAEGNDLADPLGLAGEQRRVATTVTRNGSPLAAVSHRSSLPPFRLLRSLRPAIVLSLDNARLEAATSAELKAARATALRLVERSEAERRVLQANLHDGAQQRLVGLAMAVRRIRAAAATDDEPGFAPAYPSGRLDDADALVAEMLTSVRRVAHGIHPMLLADLGLGPALRELADTSTRLVVRVTDESIGTAGSTAADAAAYSSAEVAMDDALRRNATRLELRLRRTPEGSLRMVVLDDGALTRSPDLSGPVDDRVEALAGLLQVERRPGALATKQAVR